MAIPKYTRDRYDAEDTFPLGCRMIHKSTGDVYIRGAYRTVRECWIMRINPGVKTSITWWELLKYFERENACI